MRSENYDADHLEKPYWLRPPWVVLFDLIRLHQVRPWEVNLVYLLATLIGEMKKKGQIDFTASGIALLSSATIYRMKSELILELQKPPTPPPSKRPEFIPPPIQIPFRYEYSMTNVDSLIEALDDTLKNGSMELQPRLIPIITAPPIIKEIDDFLVDIEKKIEDLDYKISQLGDRNIPLSALTTGLERLASIRTFLLVLFLACREHIELRQDEDFGEIYISSKGRNLNDGATKI
jgi:chromatin segregation and condensation protein Rec8/ScpA/Scc1 (kleisin family)